MGNGDPSGAVLAADLELFEDRDIHAAVEGLMRVGFGSGQKVAAAGRHRFGERLAGE